MKQTREKQVKPQQMNCTLTEDEIRMILRGADELIAVGGRNLLAKLLKGSKDKNVLAHGLDQCPAYGFYRNLTLSEITERIDWMIREDYLRTEYNWKMPVLVFSEKGWSIEAETYGEELYEACRSALDAGADGQFPDMKETNRQVVFQVLEKIRKSGDRRYLSFLEQWKKTEVQKVRARISAVMASLENPGQEAVYTLSKAKRENWREIMDLIHRAAGEVYGTAISGEATDWLDWIYSRQRIQGLIETGILWILKRCGMIIGTGQMRQNWIGEIYELPEEGEPYGLRMIRALETEVKKEYSEIKLEWSLPFYEELEQAGYRMEQEPEAGPLEKAIKYAVFKKEIG